MATIKSHTDLEQSEKLAKILPIESADAYWWYSGKRFYIESIDDGDFNENSDIRAWSLAALISILPKIHKLKPILDLEENSIQYSGIDLYVVADNPVDACYAMIIKLNEQNLL